MINAVRHDDALQKSASTCRLLGSKALTLCRKRDAEALSDEGWLDLRERAVLQFFFPCPLGENIRLAGIAAF